MKLHPGALIIYYIQGCLHIAYIISGALNEITSRGAYNLLNPGVLTYCIYHFRGAYNDRIKSELKRVAEEKRRLTAEFDRAMGRVSTVF